MKIYKVDFDSVWPVGNTLILAANDEDEAWGIATDTIAHTGISDVTEVDISKPCVIEYLSGDY